jgi:hypothetical protein
MRTPQYTITNLIVNYLLKYVTRPSRYPTLPITRKIQTVLQEKYDSEDTEKLGVNHRSFNWIQPSITIYKEDKNKHHTKETLKYSQNFRNVKTS